MRIIFISDAFLVYTIYSKFMHLANSHRNPVIIASKKNGGKSKCNNSEKFPYHDNKFIFPIVIYAFAK